MQRYMEQMLKKGTIMTSDIFDVYVDKDRYMKKL